METFNEQDAKLIEFRNQLNQPDLNWFNDCIRYGMFLLEKQREYLTENGYKFPFNLKECKYAMEQAVIDRCDNKPMLDAVIDYVEKVQYIARHVNDLNEK